MSAALKAVLDLMNVGTQLGEQGRHQEAQQRFLEAQRECLRLGVRSAQLSWCLAVCHDYLGEHERALLYIREHLLLDPLSPLGHRSLGIITERACAALASIERDLSSPETPRMYALLLDLEAADVRAHLAVARHWMHTNRLAEALELLQAVVVVAPTNESAWHLLSSASERGGRKDLVRKAAAALLGLGRTQAVPMHLVGAKVADA